MNQIFYPFGNKNLASNQKYEPFLSEKITLDDEIKALNPILWIDPSNLTVNSRLAALIDNVGNVFTQSSYSKRPKIVEAYGSRAIEFGTISANRYMTTAPILSTNYSVFAAVSGVVKDARNAQYFIGSAGRGLFADVTSSGIPGASHGDYNEMPYRLAVSYLPLNIGTINILTGDNNNGYTNNTSAWSGNAIPSINIDTLGNRGERIDILNFVGNLHYLLILPQQINTDIANIFNQLNTKFS